MLSVRTLARSAPRAVQQLTRQPARLILAPGAGVLAPSTVSSSSSSSLSSFASALFSTRAPAQAQQQQQQQRGGAASRGGQSDETTRELAAKIESEIQFENEFGQQDQLPGSVKDWLKNSDFELVDTPGKLDIKLVRNYGGEKITVTFNIGSLDAMDEDMYNEENMDEDMSEDESLAEPADTSAQRGGGNKRAKGTTSRPAIEEEDEDLDEDEDDGLSDEEAMAPSVSLHIVIEKPNRTEAALAIDATAQHGTLVVDNVSYYDSSATAKGATQEAMWAQQGVYAGPPFHTLDEDLQMIVERYLEDRGVGQAMAIFAADYIDVKEQREYLRWLSNVKKFVTA